MLKKTHKILGLTMAPVMIIWFISGMVMMYVPHPRFHKTALDRIDYMVPLKADTVTLSFQDAWEKLGLTYYPKAARLNMLMDRPVYFFKTQSGELKGVFADSGECLSDISVEMALASAAGYLKNYLNDTSKSRALVKLLQPGSEGVDISVVTSDQWTVGTATRNWYRPFYKLDCNDDAGTWIYVSQKSGEVCQIVTRWERILGWLGSIPHWIYFTIIRNDLALWRQVVIWLSGIATVAVLSGLLLGGIDFRWKKYGRNRHKRSSSYIGMKKWHHYLGLFFGIPTLLWIFSGLLSMSPFKWYTPTAPTAVERSIMAGGEALPSQFVLHSSKAVMAIGEGDDVRMVSLMTFDGSPYYLCRKDASHTYLVRADTSKREGRPIAELSPKKIRLLGQYLMPEYRMISHTVLTEYDAYYVDKNNRSALPVLRIDFDDPSRTRFYINMADGTIMRRYDKSARLNRWLYHFFHCLDLPILYQYRWFRDSIMLFLLCGGTLISLSGFYIGIKRQLKHRIALGKTIGDYIKHFSV